MENEHGQVDETSGELQKKKILRMNKVFEFEKFNLCTIRISVLYFWSTLMEIYLYQPSE